MQYADATEQFASDLNDPTKWSIRSGVPIFKPHRRVDPATGREIVVDVPKLYRIVGNLQRMERQGGVPIRMTLGHTEPGKPETEQPPVAGYYRNARVATFGPKGEPAVVVDEWLDPTYRGNRKNFPYRSSEYYDDTEQITGVALLTRDPYLDLGVVAYEGVTMAIKGPVLYSAAGQPRTAYQYMLGDTPTGYGYPYPYAGGPLHKPKGPGGGQFTSGTGGTGQGSSDNRPPQPQKGYIPRPELVEDPPEEVPQPPPEWSDEFFGLLQNVSDWEEKLAQTGWDSDERIYHAFQSGMTPEQVVRAVVGGVFDPINNSRRYSYSRGDTNMWPYGYDANGQPLPAPQAPNLAPAPQPQAAPVYPTAYQAPHVQTGYGLPTAPVPTQPQAPRGPAPVGYSQPQPAPYTGQPVAPAPTPYGGPFPGPAYTQSPGAMSHSNDWQFRAPHQNSRYDGMPTDLNGPMPGLGGPQGMGGPPSGGFPPQPGDLNGNGVDDGDEAGLNALHHHMSQAVEHLSRYMGANRRPAPYGPPAQQPQQAPQGFPQGQGSADSPYSRSGARPRPYDADRVPVAYQLELDKLQARLVAQDSALKVVMYERDQADTAACEAEIRRLAYAGWSVDGNDVVKLKNTPVDQRAGFVDEIMTKYSRVGTEAMPPILGDPSPMHQIGDPSQQRATREEMFAALRMTPPDAPAEQFGQALQYARHGGQQTQFGMNGEVQGPGNPYGDPYGT